MRRCGMKIYPIAATVFLVILGTIARAADEPTAPGLAREVWKASGGESWSGVKELRFTFVVEVEGKTVASAAHIWKVAEGTDEVTWKDKHVTINVNTPPTEGDAKAAYARWVNDSYWLIAPLKVLDPGVTVKAEGAKEINGVASETLQLSFGAVGLTPTDRYVMYVDPQTKLLRSWDYQPKEGAGMQATWEKYETFGGLKLSTEHHFGGKTIKFTDVKVTMAGG